MKKVEEEEREQDDEDEDKLFFKKKTNMFAVKPKTDITKGCAVDGRIHGFSYSRSALKFRIVSSAGGSSTSIRNGRRINGRTGKAGQGWVGESP